MSGFAEFHGELRAVARDLLGDEPGGAPAWDDLAEAGWCGLEVPEALGGAGATFAETAVVVEELGRAAAATPYLGAVVLGVGALTLAAPGPERDDLLAATATGECRPVLVLPGDAAPPVPPPTSSHRSDVGSDVAAAGHADLPAVLDSGVPGGSGAAHSDLEVPGAAVSGAVRSTPSRQTAFVLDAADATVLFLPVAGADGRPAVAVVDPVASGVTVTPQPVLDATRRLATVEVADGVELGRLLPFAADPDRALALLHDRVALAVALDGLGLAGAMLDATVAYAKVREQFGRPIGSFQAVKHQCADLAVQLAVGRALADAAVDALVAAGTGEDAAAVTDAGVAVAMAKAHAGAAAVEVVGTALQLHGGIGYTWESGVHVYLKRATLDRSLFGSPAAHRRRLARRYGTPSAA